MFKIRQTLLGNHSKGKIHSSDKISQKIVSLIVEKPNNTIIRPYCVYPIVAHTKTEAAWKQLAGSSELASWNARPSRNRTENGEQRPRKAYQRLSVVRAKDKQLSSYGGKAFSLDREYWRQQRWPFVGAVRQSSAYIRTALV